MRLKPCSSRPAKLQLWLPVCLIFAITVTATAAAAAKPTQDAPPTQCNSPSAARFNFFPGGAINVPDGWTQQNQRRAGNMCSGQLLPIALYGNPKPVLHFQPQHELLTAGSTVDTSQWQQQEAAAHASGGSGNQARAPSAPPAAPAPATQPDAAAPAVQAQAAGAKSSPTPPAAAAQSSPSTAPVAAEKSSRTPAAEKSSRTPAAATRSPSPAPVAAGGPAAAIAAVSNSSAAAKNAGSAPKAAAAAAPPAAAAAKVGVAAAGAAAGGGPKTAAAAAAAAAAAPPAAAAAKAGVAAAAAAAAKPSAAPAAIAAKKASAAAAAVAPAAAGDGHNQTAVAVSAGVAAPAAGDAAASAASAALAASEDAVELDAVLGGLAALWRAATSAAAAVRPAAVAANDTEAAAAAAAAKPKAFFGLGRLLPFQDRDSRWLLGMGLGWLELGSKQQGGTTPPAAAAAGAAQQAQPQVVMRVLLEAGNATSAASGVLPDAGVLADDAAVAAGDSSSWLQPWQGLDVGIGPYGSGASVQQTVDSSYRTLLAHGASAGSSSSSSGGTAGSFAVGTWTVDQPGSYQYTVEVNGKQWVTSEVHPWFNSVAKLNFEGNSTAGRRDLFDPEVFQEGINSMSIKVTVLKGTALLSNGTHKQPGPPTDQSFSSPEIDFYFFMWSNATHDSRPSALVQFESCRPDAAIRFADARPTPVLIDGYRLTYQRVPDHTSAFFLPVYHVYGQFQKGLDGSTDKATDNTEGNIKNFGMYITRLPGSPANFSLTGPELDALKEGWWQFSVEGSLWVPLPHLASLLSLAGMDRYGNSDVMYRTVQPSGRITEGVSLLNSVKGAGWVLPDYSETPVGLQKAVTLLDYFEGPSAPLVLGDKATFSWQWTGLDTGRTTCRIEGMGTISMAGNCSSPLIYTVRSNLNQTLTVSYEDVCRKTHNASLTFGPSFGWSVDQKELGLSQSDWQGRPSSAGGPASLLLQKSGATSRHSGGLLGLSLLRVFSGFATAHVIASFLLA